MDYIDDTTTRSDKKEFIIDWNETDDWVSKLITEEMLNLDIDQKKFDELVGKLPDIIPGFISKSSNIVLHKIKSRAQEGLKKNAEIRKEYELKIYDFWKGPLDLLELYVGIAYEIGDRFNRIYRRSATENNDYTSEALTRLHARGCLIANEILVLLKSGYADGADARWRTLHEIAVASLFISKHGNETAERYLLYSHIESYKAANQHRSCYNGAGEEPVSDERLVQLKRTYDRLCERFGKNFKEPYGWALKALGTNGTNFGIIERSVELSHLRPYYKLASYNVHADPKGIMFKHAHGCLGNKILLAGPSYFGLADAGHSTSISLLQITFALLSIKPSLEGNLSLEIMAIMVTEIGEAFLAVHDSLEDRHEKST